MDALVAGKGVAGSGRGSAAVLCSGDGTTARGSGGDWVDELQELGCELANGLMGAEGSRRVVVGVHRARRRQWWPAGELGVHRVCEVKGGRSGAARLSAAHATPACRRGAERGARMEQGRRRGTATPAQASQARRAREAGARRGTARARAEQGWRRDRRSCHGARVTASPVRSRGRRRVRSTAVQPRSMIDTEGVARRCGLGAGAAAASSAPVQSTALSTHDDEQRKGEEGRKKDGGRG